jgi:rhodanese-related sulfurtransferase
MRRRIAEIACLGMVSALLAAATPRASARELAEADRVQPITPQEVMALIIDGTGPVVIDVRPPNQYEQGHVPGAISVYSKWIHGRLPELEPYRERGIVIYCANGLNSKRAGIKLLDEGFRKLFVMKGQLPRWKQLGYPLEVSPAE